jgi:phage terminase small subunit
MPPLKNQRHELFVQLIFESQGTPTPAYECAIHAGFSLKAARQVASRLLTYANIRARLDELNAAAASARIMSVQERKERLSEIGRARLTDFVVEGQIKLPDKPKNTGALLKLKKKTVKVHEAVMSEEYTDIELLNPIAAIQELNKMDHTYAESPEKITEIHETFVFIMPDGTKLAPRQLIDGNSSGKSPG